MRDHLAEVVAKRDSRISRTPPGPSALPPRLLRTAAFRIRMAALVYAVAYALAYGSALLFDQHEPTWYRGVDLGSVFAVLSILGSLGMVALTFHFRRAAVLLDLALLYEVFGALGIECYILLHPLSPDFVRTGISWTCVWVAIFPIIVPATRGRTIAATLASASVGPLLYFITVADGNPIMPPANLVQILLPYYISAGIGIVSFKIVYKLRSAADRALRMGSYTLGERLGEGGMGEVWKAEHRMLARPAAIKLIRPGMLGAAGENGRQQLLARFEREAKATAALTSPHTVQIYDFGVTDDGVFYYVMELLHGLDLRTLVERFGPLPPGRVVHLLEQVCASLEEAHDGGLIHRDVKPANVFTCRVGFKHDFVKVLDFGLVLSRRERSGEDLRLTLPHTAAGTPAFMAPEMILEDREIDGRADLYGVGCLAYWLLTGGHVFDEDSSMRMAVAHVQTPPVPPSERSELPVPPALESLVLACLEKDPDRRPPHAGALRRRLAEMDGKEWGSDEAARWWRLHLPGEARQPGTPSIG